MLIDDYLYMHGGFSVNGKNNDFVKFNVTEPVVQWEVI
jgi:hypothetical protein